MKRKFTVLLLVPAVALVLSSGVQADGKILPKLEGSTATSGKVYPKVEVQVTAHSKSEALAINRRIRIDIGKVEAELSSTKQGGAGKSTASRKGRASPDTRAGIPLGVKNASESLLRETDKLSRLHGKEKLTEGSTRYSGPMKKDAQRLHRLALDHGKASGTPVADRILGEMKAVLGRLKNQNSAHERWIQGLNVGAGGNPVGKPVPANMQYNPGSEAFPKSDPGVGIRAPGVVSDKHAPSSGETGFDGVDGEITQGVQGQTGVVFPKVQVKGMENGQTGYEGVDGESLGN